MKYLLILLMVVVVLWLWRSKRPDAGAQQPEAPRAKRGVLPPAEMVACDICDVHLPRTEALAGPGGLYCSDAHRRQAGER